MNTTKIKKIISTFLAVTTIMTVFSINVFAVNEDFDDPEDNVVSQNEQHMDLLNEELIDPPNISSPAYVLIDSNSGDILMGKNYDQQMEPASTTKVMTVLLALQRLNMDEVITITPEMAEAVANIPGDYVKIGLQENEEITVENLIYAAVLKSANDACLVMGMKMAGTEEKFCDMMNKKAEDIGCLNTHFSSSFGYAYEDNLVTAYDLCLILQEAILNTDYSKIATTYTYTIPATNMYSSERVLTNSNRFISTTEYSYEYYVGGKTGFTDSAGYTLVSAAKKDDRMLVGCVLKSPDAGVRYKDLTKLFDYGFTSFTTLPITATEFAPLINETNTYIENLLAQTNLSLSDSKPHYSDYLTTTSSRTTSGSINKVELSGLYIDTSLKKQTLNVPICKEYSDGKVYIVGVLEIEIEEKASIVPINPEKKSGWTSLKSILIVIAGISGLVLILIIALLIFRKQIIKRRERDYWNKSKML